MKQDKRELNQIKKGRLNLEELEEMGLSESFEEFKEKQIQRRESEKKIINKMSLKSAGTSLLALGAGVGLALLIPAASSVIGGIAMLTAGYKGLEALSVTTHLRASRAMDFNKSYANQNEFMKTLSEDEKVQAKEKYDEMTERLDEFGEPLANAIKNSEKFMNMKMDKRIEALKEAKFNLDFKEPAMAQQEITMEDVSANSFDNCNVSEEREKELMNEISKDIDNKKDFEGPKDKAVTHKQKNTI